ncbi:threonine-phosphate decarboxylase [Marinobacter halodurans]|uniref:threonine-phosphate decarboxylase n=1 Tax=Marinobacter halodurans TaxID=2528979 RepID=A0ABY1ZG61_9GAMM|nr:threonine-phosphate decarboxylase CobD [Marinobacter halodurans]TBW50341.1 threonine-phosphate decarboxylase [Marinobacter halodurans]
MTSRNRLEHGGRLNEAARQWGIPRDQWLDLSTGINPDGWPIPALPASVWQRLPEEDDGLEPILRDWTGTPARAGVLPVPGSQAAIQGLPRLRKAGRVGVPTPGYEEHGRRWAMAGHDVVPIDLSRLADGHDWLDSLDVLVWIHPNNPTGLRIDREQLLDWHHRLQARGGWLVVDEAFLLPDESAQSLAAFTDRAGLLVLKSLGKFFGLAGLRAGALLGDAGIVDRLAAEIGPWAVNGPARAIMETALQDTHWQCRTADRLRRDSARLARLLADAGLYPQGGTAMFRYVVTKEADRIADELAKQGIWVRRFARPPALRFGLPAWEGEWTRLGEALSGIRVPVGESADSGSHPSSVL